MVEFRRHVARAGGLVGVALLCACAVTPPPPQPHAGFEKRLIEWTAGHAMTQGTERQVIAAESEPSARAPAETMLGSGEKLWLRSGKSRVVRFRRPVRRVSVGNPEIAGVVVLGPNTILINGKPLPEARGGEQYRPDDPAAPPGHRLQHDLHPPAELHRDHPHGVGGGRGGPGGPQCLRRRLLAPAGDARGHRRRAQSHGDGGARHRFPQDRHRVRHRLLPGGRHHSDRAPSRACRFCRST